MCPYKMGHIFVSCRFITNNVERLLFLFFENGGIIWKITVGKWIDKLTLTKVFFFD